MKQMWNWHKSSKNWKPISGISATKISYMLRKHIAGHQLCQLKRAEAPQIYGLKWEQRQRIKLQITAVKRSRSCSYYQNLNRPIPKSKSWWISTIAIFWAYRQTLARIPMKFRQWARYPNSGRYPRLARENQFVNCHRRVKSQEEEGRKLRWSNEGPQECQRNLWDQPK